MGETITYANFVLIVAVAALVMALSLRLARARRALEKALATESGRAEREEIAALARSFAELAARFQDLREEVRRSIRKEVADRFETEDFHAALESAILDKLTRGAFTNHVKQTLDEQYRMLSTYLENEVIPKAVTKSLAESGSLPVRKPRRRFTVE